MLKSALMPLKYLIYCTPENVRLGCYKCFITGSTILAHLTRSYMFTYPIYNTQAFK